MKYMILLYFIISISCKLYDSNGEPDMTRICCNYININSISYINNYIYYKANSVLYWYMIHFCYRTNICITTATLDANILCVILSYWAIDLGYIYIYIYIYICIYIYNAAVRSVGWFFACCVTLAVRFILRYTTLVVDLTFKEVGLLTVRKTIIVCLTSLKHCTRSLFVLPL